MHFNDSYKIWSYKKMRQMIIQYTKNPRVDMNRTFLGFYIEWWIHNIGYYITLPFCFVSKTASRLNHRLKHVDLESHIKEENENA